MAHLLNCKSALCVGQPEANVNVKRRRVNVESNFNFLLLDGRIHRSPSAIQPVRPDPMRRHIAQGKRFRHLQARPVRASIGGS
jgi:hypothetical protein